MDTEVATLNIEDYEECLTLMDSVFTVQNGWKMQMRKELPKVFATPERYAKAFHWGIRDNGRLCAVVGFYPMDLIVNGLKIRCCTVGNVVTRADQRAKGYMRQCFTRAMQELPRQDIVLARLGGLRQRYNSCGYERAGTACRYSLTKYNVLKCVDAAAFLKYSFRELNEFDDETLNDMLKLHNSRRCYVERYNAEGLWHVLHHHFMQPCAIVDEQGRLQGYLTASEKGGVVSELVTRDEAERLNALAAWITYRRLDEADVLIMPWELISHYMLGRVCEHFSEDSPSMFCVLQWDLLIDALIKFKHSYSALPDGEIVLCIEGCGNLIIGVKGDNAGCQKSDRASDISMSRMEAARFLFGPLAASAVRPIPHRLQALCNAYFPLPLTWFPQDSV
ncbi:MAG: GNAT family N-acetyltransferase [Capsulimonadaceae bacterium]|nr:GNAT family N-acetyltransferase [Capsulimonadaceae bacterium]